MDIKVTNEMIVKNINLNDLLTINNLFFKNQTDYSKERFLLEIKKELETADIKDIIYSSSFIQNIILHYEDVKAFSMFADPENLYSDKELDILQKKEKKASSFMAGLNFQKNLTSKSFYVKMFI